ncbi:uncharacterized protein EURHEDRAFT_285774 [Aspergillus ruber CBS 135680]|uniref:Uncharacterized protein n=1 Tax=Aspergillus ruber (strain CBS 135680) TaxID=1388766 RepID=A0A017S3B6_ASPRC|nr:uncharacterized protein EURHEDRAFT_285774 [Aspergillus ruber CBS 135680]EYE90665.1 hypothetical protein EURHEDRAFT_285774 [Aspergillus ruber CBS 135680]
MPDSTILDLCNYPFNQLICNHVIPCTRTHLASKSYIQFTPHPKILDHWVADVFKLHEPRSEIWITLFVKRGVDDVQGALECAFVGPDICIDSDLATMRSSDCSSTACAASGTTEGCLSIHGITHLILCIAQNGETCIVTFNINHVCYSTASDSDNK